MDRHSDKYDAYVEALKNAGYSEVLPGDIGTIPQDFDEHGNYRPVRRIGCITAPPATLMPLKRLEERFADKIYTPKRILRHGIATIVFWQDGTKTVVKRHADELDNEYTAFCAALAIKVFGSNSQIKSVLRHKTETVEPKKKAVVAQKRKFKEGDRVKYLGGGGGNNDWYPEIGGEGTVLSIEHFGVCVLWDGFNSPYWISKSLVEVVD